MSWVLSLALLATIAIAAPVPPRAGLSELERSQLRNRIENLLSEVELLLRNRNSTRVDLGKQAREFELFEVFRRIPTEEDLTSLEKQLRSSASERSLQLSRVSVLKRSRPGAPPPRSARTDEKPFRPSPNQISEEITLLVQGEGGTEPVRRWMEALPHLTPRLIVPEGSVQARKDGSWEFRARAYRFRELRFPKLLPRDPMQLLPAWARTHPTLFAEKEPLLWQRVQKIRELIPRTPEAYEEYGQFLLNRARMNYFIAKAPRSND